MGLGLSKNQFRMMAVLLSGAFLAVLNATLMTPALPTIMGDMGVDSTTVQWLTSGYALTEAVVIPLAAYLMGRFSTRRLFIGGLSIFACGSLVAALSPSFPVLLAGRVMQAAATGFVMPMVFSVVLLLIPRERRGSAMGIVGLIIGFAPTIGPSLSGILVDTVGWRAIFGIVTTLAVVIVLLAAKELAPFGEFRRTKFDALSVVLSTIGLVSLLYGLSSFSSSSNLAINAALIVAGLAIIGAYAWRQLHLDEPMLRVGILRTAQYRTVVIIIALFQAALIGMETIMPLYIQGVLGHSATVSGMTLLPGAVIGAFTGLFAGRLFDKHGVRRPVLLGAAVIAVGLVGFVAVFRVDSPIYVVALFYAIMAVGIQFTMTPVNTWGVNSLPNDAIQHAQSTSNTINQVAASFGTALLVSVAATVSGQVSVLAGVERTFTGYHAAFCTTALLAGCAVALILAFVRDKKRAQVANGAATPAAAADAAGATAGEQAAGLAMAAGEETGSSLRASTGSAPAFAGKPAASAGETQAATPASAGNLEPTADERAATFVQVANAALNGLTLAQAMNPHAACVQDTATMGQVIGLIAATDTTGVSVVDSAGKLVGYVTDGDIMRYLARLDMNLSSPMIGVNLAAKETETLEARITALGALNVMELATKRVVSVDLDTPLDVACGVLAKRKIKKVPVTKDGKLVGALSRRNILHAIITGEKLGS